MREVDAVIRALAILLLLTTPALAQTQCPGSVQSWSSPLPAPMQWMTYDLSSLPGVTPGLLTVIYLNGTAESFLGVPQTVATAFPISANPAQFFANRIASVYHELLLFQRSNCPLQTSTPGALWTK